MHRGPEISPRRGKQLSCSHVGIPVLKAENWALELRPVCTPIVCVKKMQLVTAPPPPPPFQSPGVYTEG